MERSLEEVLKQVGKGPGVVVTMISRLLQAGW